MHTTLFTSYALLAVADPSNLFGTVVGWICKLSYLLALITFISGAFRHKHDPTEAMTIMISSVLFAVGVSIINLFFNTAGLPSAIVIGQ